MDYEAPALTWMHSPHRQPVMTFTFDLQNLMRSSVGLGGYSCKFHRDCSSCSWDIVVIISVRTNEGMNVVDRQTNNIMPSLTLLLSGGESINVYSIEPRQR